MSLNVGESGNSRYVGYVRRKRKKPCRNFGSTLQLAGVADELNSGIVLYRDLVRLQPRLPTMDLLQENSVSGLLNHRYSPALASFPVRKPIFS